MAQAIAVIGEQFEHLDVDRDRILSLDEFLRREGDRDVLKRDFRLYDFDLSGSLSRSEFAAASGVVPPRWRGSLPDPQDQLVATAIEALDQSYDNWNRRPAEFVNAHSFVAKFIASISDGGRRFVTGRLIVQADRNSDGLISRGEAMQFLQQQLGVIWHDGPPLREPTGRLVRFDRFLAVDKDRNNELSRVEFLSHWWNGAAAVEDFRANDRNGNGRISYAEFAHQESQNYFDPIEWFRAADNDLDASLDRNELNYGSPIERQHLVASTFSAFDNNGDGKLSLIEYRRSMHANVNCAWHLLPVDADRDGKLSYGEFVFDRAEVFQLQRRYFFHRLDRDGDGQLSDDEFEFRKQTPHALRMLSATTSESRLLYQDPEFPRCDWPTVSPDRQTVLFRRASAGEDELGQIALVTINDGTVREVCDGSHPCWAPDGKQFVCTRGAGGDEVWIMKSDGWSGQAIAEGHAPSWSPDGASIAYLHDNGIWIYDIATGDAQEVFRREDHRYQDLGSDIAWSPDSRSLAVLGTAGQHADLVVLNAVKPGQIPWQLRNVRTLQAAVCRQDLDWSAANAITIAMRESKRPRTQLYRVNPKDQSAPQRIERFEIGVDWKSACHTADGKWYIAVSEN